MKKPARVAVVAVIGLLVGASSWFLYWFWTPPEVQFGSTVDRLTENVREVIENLVASAKAGNCSVREDNFVPVARLNESFTLKVDVSLPSGAEKCTSTILLSGPAFTISPKEPVTISLNRETTSNQTIYFALLPTKPGRQVLVGGHDRFVGEASITVYEYPFIPPSISIWFPFLGTFFGGMLTLPWWLQLFGIPKKSSDSDKDDEGKERNPHGRGDSEQDDQEQEDNIQTMGE